MFAGLSVIGQPHIMVRFMSMKSSGNSMSRARVWYYGWFTVFYTMATIVGMLSRVYLPEIGSFDAELALPTMAQQLLPPALVGLVLAAMFAATMSTADSLLLSCSCAITHDLLPHKVEKRWMLWTATIVTTFLALLLALMNNQSVFNLVILSWSTLASAFAPILLVYVFGGRMTETAAISMLVIGVTTALSWRWMGLHQMVYEGMPGILAGLLFYLGWYAVYAPHKLPPKVTDVK
jgi:Na+/proline symporter